MHTIVDYTVCPRILAKEESAEDMVADYSDIEDTVRLIGRWSDDGQLREFPKIVPKEKRSIVASLPMNAGVVMILIGTTDIEANAALALLAGVLEAIIMTDSLDLGLRQVAKMTRDDIPCESLNGMDMASRFRKSVREMFANERDVIKKWHSWVERLDKIYQQRYNY